MGDQNTWASFYLSNPWLHALKIFCVCESCFFSVFSLAWQQQKMFSIALQLRRVFASPFSINPFRSLNRRFVQPIPVLGLDRHALSSSCYRPAWAACTRQLGSSSSSSKNELTTSCCQNVEKKRVGYSSCFVLFLNVCLNAQTTLSLSLSVCLK